MTLHPTITNKRVVNYFSALEDKFINLHGDKYSYKQSVYINAKTPIIIYCNSCNTTFEQTPDNHVQGKGCKACAMKVLHDKQRMTLSDFIQKSKSIHGNKFDYSKVEYVSNDTLVTILCPEHGEFQISPSGHWVSKTGCTKCGILEAWNTRDKPTTESFIEASKLIHRNHYDYSEATYTGSRDNVKIVCKVHGTFEQNPTNHLRGSGCPDCGLELVRIAKSDTAESFIEKAKAVHGSYYNYDKVNYVRSQKNVTITCKTHGDFKQIPSRHLQGAGCTICNKGFSFAPVPTTLYYLKIVFDDLVLYKIGITMHSVKKRYSVKDYQKMEVLYTKIFSTGQEAYEAEQKVLIDFKNFKYTGADLIESGNTELFITDVLNKDLKGLNLKGNLN